jgi:hypothetical protein
MKILFVITLLMTSVASAFSQRLTASVPKDDLKTIIAQYKSATPETLVHQWMRTMPPPATANASFHPEIIRNLPPEVAKLRIDNKELEETVSQVLGPVLSQYNRGRAYRIVIIGHATPSILFDLVATLVITTGMLNRVESDDALLGAVAHEIAHELNAASLRDLRKRYQVLAASSPTDVLLQQTLIQLAEVELDCDAFAAMTLAVIGRNPKEFANLLLGINKDFHEQLATDHPPAQIRATLITSIVPDAALKVKPQATKYFLAMKSLAAQLPPSAQKKINRPLNHTR